jgi:hypothetical protein
VSWADAVACDADKCDAVRLTSSSAWDGERAAAGWAQEVKPNGLMDLCAAHASPAVPRAWSLWHNPDDQGLLFLFLPNRLWVGISMTFEQGSVPATGTRFPKSTRGKWSKYSPCRRRAPRRTVIKFALSGGYEMSSRDICAICASAFAYLYYDPVKIVGKDGSRTNAANIVEAIEALLDGNTLETASGNKLPLIAISVLHAPPAL